MTRAPDLGSLLQQKPEIKHAPVLFGSVGLGGYAGHICGVLQACSSGDSAPVKLAAIWEPDLQTHAARAAELRAAGIKVFDEYDELLAEPIEAVWLPIPIDLHRSFTQKALGAGKAVMCEKPAAGCVDDVDAMIAARDRAGLPVAVGFQDIYDPTTLALKRQLLEGEIGKINSAVVWGCWPRGEDYFARNAWVGRFQRNGTWIMDSPANNAMAHFVNLAIFLLGSTEKESAQPTGVEAELYRANEIENFDTCAMRLMAGAPVLVLLTHACAHAVEPHIELRGSEGSVRYRAFDCVEIEGRRGLQRWPLESGSVRNAMVDRFARWIRGSLGDDLIATLEIARAPLVAVNGASEATSVVRVPDACRRDIRSNGPTLRTIDGIEAAFERCAAMGQMPHESGHCPWSAPSGKRDLKGYAKFAGPKRGEKLSVTF